jgi:pyrroloquinoline-quinone synthase
MPGTPRLDAAIRARHLLKHPFYVAWSAGELPLPTLRTYAQQYYHFERAFPRYVAGAYARVADPAGRRVLLENLIDEEGRDPTHPELWIQFALALGVSRRSVEHSAPIAATRQLCRTYERFALGGSAAEALAVLYAYESIFPEVAAEKSRGLAAHYGITDAAAHEFFRVHTQADVAHSAAERDLIAKESARTPKSAAAALRAANASLDGWWGFLDAFVGG